MERITNYYSKSLQFIISKTAQWPQFLPSCLNTTTIIIFCVLTKMYLTNIFLQAEQHFIKYFFATFIWSSCAFRVFSLDWFNWFDLWLKNNKQFINNYWMTFKWYPEESRLRQRLSAEALIKTLIILDISKSNLIIVLLYIDHVLHVHSLFLQVSWNLNACQLHVNPLINFY